MRVLPHPAPYVPGQFYKRELPGILSVLPLVRAEPQVLLIDGYVWLSAGGAGGQKPGLGAHLFQALGERVAIIGLAKTNFKASGAIEILRGRSKRPLYVTAAGMDAQLAAGHVKSMEGSYRLPTLVRTADRLAREALNT